MIDRTLATLIITIATISLVPNALLAQPSAKSPPEFAAMSYRLVGPFAGGRICRVAGVAGDPLTYYAATAGGGVWKSADGGHQWKPIFDDQPTASVGSIAVAPSDPNVVYVGTGEANIRGNVIFGRGIFKSTDAGKTWKHVWKQIGQIGTMVVHPKNADIAYAAVLGHAFGVNQERGVYRTLDGGKSWKKILYVNDETGCSDVAIDPTNPRVLFAGFWQTRRRPWEMTSGGPGSDLFVSRDGGETWTSLKKDAEKIGLPKPIWGKIGVAVASSNGKRVYAIIEAETGGVFRSDDGGATWANVNRDRIVRQRAWYYSTLTVHPTNADVVYAPNVPLLKSIDGGRSFGTVRGPHHGDHHDLWIDPANPNRMICGNDGGVDISTDGGQSWFAPPLPISQFYHVSADNRTPYRVMGCMQDLGSASGPSNSLKFGISHGDWQSVGGGEAGHCVADPSDPDIVFAGEYGGIMTRFDFRTKQARNITVNQVNPSGIDPAKHAYRFQWTAPILISPHDSKTVYHAGNHIFRTRDGGQTWDSVSPDLTRNDKQKQQWSGGPITGDNTGAEVYCTVFALAESPKQKGLLWAGTDDGKVHVSLDDAKTWTDLTTNVPELPDWGTVVCIEPSPFDAATAYLVVDNHRMDDYRPHVWKTSDTGKTWTKVVEGLDTTLPCHAIREDGKKKGLLYLGTDRGVMVSADAGANWRSLQLDLPTSPVHDLVVKGDDLVVGTHGRSIWILDDLTPVREWSSANKEKSLQVYPMLAATKWYYGGGSVSGHLRSSTTSNPTPGAIAWFYLGKSAKKVTIEISNEKGDSVAKYIGKPDSPSDSKDDEDGDGEPKREFAYKTGLNKFVWDMTHEGAEPIRGAKVDAGNPAQGIPVSLGTYRLKVTADGTTLSTTVVVKADPRLDPKMVSIEQEKLALEVRDNITKLSRTVARIRAIQKQIALRKDLLKDVDTAKALVKASEDLSKKLDAIEEKLHNPKAKVVYDIFAARGGAMLYSQLVWLLGNVSDGDGIPTKPQRELAVELTKRLASHVDEFEKLLTTDVAKLNADAKQASVPELYIPAMKK
jgi:photosystem II stability/assembly factor-like uncharacterized protein